MRSRLSQVSPALAAWLCIFLSFDSLQAQVSLPLRGYYKPGKFFPVVIHAIDAASESPLQGNGCIPTFIEPGNYQRSVVPVLAVGEIKELRWKSGSAALQIPKDDEILVAATTEYPEQCGQLFPGKRIILVHLDPADLLPGRAAAWESLDGIVLTCEVFSRISDEQRSILLAEGIVLAGVGETAPDARWPWRREGQIWKLAATSLPRNIIAEDAFAPTYNWNPGTAPRTGRQVLGIGILSLLLTSGTLLFQNKHRVLVAALILLFGSFFIALWRGSLPTVDRIGGDILVCRDGLSRRDSWTFERGKKASEQSIPWVGLVHPIFASANAFEQSHLRLVVNAAGDFAYKYESAAQHTIGFVGQEVEKTAATTLTPSADSPMQMLAKSLYLNGSERVAGQISTAAGRWATVVIKK